MYLSELLLSMAYWMSPQTGEGETLKRSVIHYMNQAVKNEGKEVTE